jgi:hypothetical protein
VETHPRAPAPPTRIPQKASNFAARLWGLSIWERFQLAVQPNEETAALLFRAGLESFAPDELRDYVENDRDVIPLMVEWMQLDNGLVRPLAQSILRIWWYPWIYNVWIDPLKLYNDVCKDNPALAPILRTAKGRAWWNITVYNLATFMRAYAGIQGDGRIEPPPNAPERLKRKALQGAARLMGKITGPKN